MFLRGKRHDRIPNSGSNWTLWNKMLSNRVTIDGKSYTVIVQGSGTVWSTLVVPKGFYILIILTGTRAKNEFLCCLVCMELGAGTMW